MCENLLEKMAQQSNSGGKLDLLTPFLSRLGQESAFPFMRLILPEVLQNAYRGTTPTKPFVDGRSLRWFSSLKEVFTLPLSNIRWTTAVVRWTRLLTHDMTTFLGNASVYEVLRVVPLAIRNDRSSRAPQEGGTGGSGGVTIVIDSVGDGVR